MNPNNESQPTIVNHNEMHNCNVFNGNVYNATFPLPGAQVTINQYATDSIGGKPKQDTQGPIEPAEERTKRKEEAIRNMYRKLENLEDGMLGYTNHGERIKHTQLSMLLHKCLGMHPTAVKQEYRPIQEALWTILIDARNSCSKDPKESYFPQTFLNIVGYLRKQQIIINVEPIKLLRILYPNLRADVEKKLVVQLNRALLTSSSNPIIDGLENMFNFYINLLKNGEI